MSNATEMLELDNVTKSNILYIREMGASSERVLVPQRKFVFFSQKD